MWDILGTSIFILFAGLLALESAQKWRASSLAWFIASGVVAFFGGLAFLFDWNAAFSLVLLAAFLRVVAGAISRRGLSHDPPKCPTP